MKKHIPRERQDKIKLVKSKAKKTPVKAMKKKIPAGKSKKTKPVHFTPAPKVKAKKEPWEKKADRLVALGKKRGFISYNEILSRG